MPDHQDRPVAADRRWLLIAGLVGLPILVLVVALAQRTWYPTGDLAQAELRMRSLPGRPPLLGAAGRIVDAQGRQGNHPGPLMFWATWPFYWLLGSSAWAFEAATAVVNALWLTLSVWLVARRTPIAVTAWYGVVTLVLIGSYGLDALTQPWNPWVALLPFTVLMLAAWSALDGTWWAPVLAVVAGSYSLQSHVGYAPVVGVLVAVAVGAPILRAFRSRSNAAGESDGDGDGEPGIDPSPGRARWWSSVATALVVGLLAWVGPLVDLVTKQPNNAQKLVASFGSPSETPIGVGRGIAAVFQSASPWGAWVRGGEEVTGSVLPGAVFLAAWALVSLVVALRHAERRLTILNAVLGVVTLMAMFAVSRIFGALYLYVFRWVVAIVALQVFALGWGMAVLLPRPSPAVGRRLAGVAAIALIGLSCFTSQRVVRQEIPYDQSWRMERALAPAVAAELDRDQTYLVTWDDSAYLGGLGFGLILDLERRGFDVGAEPRFGAAVEPHRILCPGSYDAVLTTVTGRAALARWDAMDDAVRLASVDLRASTGGYDTSLRSLQEALAADGQQLTLPEIEQRMNFILLTPGQPRSVADPAADLVLGGVPSAVYLRDPAPAEPLDLANPVNEACRP